MRDASTYRGARRNAWRDTGAGWVGRWRHAGWLRKTFAAKKFLFMIKQTGVPVQMQRTYKPYQVIHKSLDTAVRKV